MNIKTDGSIPSIKNQHGLTVPCYIISFFEFRKDIIFRLENKGLKNIYEEHLQEFHDLLFEMYKEKNNEEHPIQKCKTYDDLCNVRLKSKYDFLKKKIEANGIISFDFPDICRLQGFIPCKLSDNDDDQFVTVYEVDMTFDDGHMAFELEKETIQKMFESLS